MKRFLIFAVIMLCLSSCALHRSTSATKNFVSKSPLEAPVVADLKVGEKITYVYQPEVNQKRRLTRQQLLEEAVAEALLKNGNADVLLQPQYTFYYIEGQKFYKVIVSGYPATYFNFRNASSEDLNLIQTSSDLQPTPHMIGVKSLPKNRHMQK